MQHYKLVRDRIIEIIESQGRTATWHVADESEYKSSLQAKLQEEITEFLSATDDKEAQEEMADIFEVIGAILKQKKWTLEDIVEIQKKKRKERGGFEKRIILEEV